MKCPPCDPLRGNRECSVEIKLRTFAKLSQVPLARIRLVPLLDIHEAVMMGKLDSLHALAVARSTES